MFAVGIDVSNRRSIVAVLSSLTNIVIKPFDVPHTSDGLNHLVDNLNTLYGEIKIVMEHTGDITKRLPYHCTTSDSLSPQSIRCCSKLSVTIRSIKPRQTTPMP